MSRAKKLLLKTKKLKEKIDRNFSQIQQLSDYPDVFDIIAEKKANTERLEDKNTYKNLKIIEDNSNKISQFSCNCITLQRIDYDFPNSDNGIELVVPPGIITASGIGSDDMVEILGGELEGRTLEVIEVKNLTTLRLDDASTFHHPENGTKVRFILNKEK